MFASCFSFNSSIKDYLYSKGVMASLSISQDKDKVTDGKLFSLDQDQRDVINRYEKVGLFDYHAQIYDFWNHFNLDTA